MGQGGAQRKRQPKKNNIPGRAQSATADFKARSPRTTSNRSSSTVSNRSSSTVSNRPARNPNARDWSLLRLVRKEDLKDWPPEYDGRDYFKVMPCDEYLKMPLRSRADYVPCAQFPDPHIRLSDVQTKEQIYDFRKQQMQWYEAAMVLAKEGKVPRTVKKELHGYLDQLPRAGALRGLYPGVTYHNDCVTYVNNRVNTIHHHMETRCIKNLKHLYLYLQSEENEAVFNMYLEELGFEWDDDNNLSYDPNAIERFPKVLINCDFKKKDKPSPNTQLREELGSPTATPPFQAEDEYHPSEESADKESKDLKETMRFERNSTKKDLRSKFEVVPSGLPESPDKVRSSDFSCARI